MKCPLCRSIRCEAMTRNRKRAFLRCVDCGLIFVPETFHLTAAQELQRYDLHDNSESNAGYVGFLTQLADVVESVCPAPGRILDFGCGRQAVLTALLRRRGRECDAFDPLYAFAPPPPGGRYGAIALCEVIEHCRDVRGALLDIGRLLDEQGIVAVRTQCPPGNVDMNRWWYAQDPTHIAFFPPQALETAAELLGKRLEATAVKDIFLLR